LVDDDDDVFDRDHHHAGKYSAHYNAPTQGMPYVHIIYISFMLPRA
jgi:hypothetical protein